MAQLGDPDDGLFRWRIRERYPLRELGAPGDRVSPSGHAIADGYRDMLVVSRGRLPTCIRVNFDAPKGDSSVKCKIPLSGRDRGR